MKILKIEVNNFCSYKHLEFTFENQGLTLIHGQTGAGKSTLCDVIPWILFGKTAKGGNVDSVLSWPGDQITTGTAYLQKLEIHRTRGPKAKDNDLYFTIQGAQPTRGKDITDTQRLINTHLGIDYSLYISGSYIHEFSETAGFFTATPKVRRTICEQLIDLSMPKAIQERLVKSKKQAKDMLEITSNSLTKLQTRLEILAANKNKIMDLHKNFDVNKEQALALLLSKYEAYETSKTRVISDLEIKATQLKIDLEACGTNNTPCPTCGAKKNDTVQAVLAEKLKHITKELNRWNTTENPQLTAIEKQQNEVNTYDSQLEDILADTQLRVRQLNELQIQEQAQRQALGDLELLEDIILTFRSSIVSNVINSLQETTNQLLLNHFDAEIQVTFDVADDVEVSILKDGNECIYGQLSKGQRQLLKLCFSTAVMQQVANHHGINISQAFFDEAFDGLSDLMKIKAFGLLKTLALQYESIFVVDHSAELKALFENQFNIQLIDGYSVIAES